MSTRRRAKSRHLIQNISIVLWTLEKYGISYRDISFSNILIRPTPFLGPSEFIPSQENRPVRYVSELLGENE